jgi:hypothetical protein
MGVNPNNDSIQTGPFETWLARWNDQITGLSAAVESWAENKLDNNPSFNFATAQADLQTALANFISSVETVTAM